jgi:hypothetical protein
MFWCVGAEFMMGGIVEVGSAVCLDSIVCAVRIDSCEECLDPCAFDHIR